MKQFHDRADLHKPPGFLEPRHKASTFSFTTLPWYPVFAPQVNDVEMPEDPGVGVGTPQTDYHQAVFGEALGRRYRRDGNGAWL